MKRVLDKANKLIIQEGGRWLIDWVKSMVSDPIIRIALIGIITAIVNYLVA